MIAVIHKHDWFCNDICYT